MHRARELLTPLSLTLSALDPAQESHAGVRQDRRGAFESFAQFFAHAAPERVSVTTRTYVQYTKEREEALSHSLTHVTGRTQLDAHAFENQKKLI